MAKSRDPSPQPQPLTQQAGRLGEAFVAAWWQQQSWTILAERWHCRWGELDLVVRSPIPNSPRQLQTLAFVEVKTRARRNWDENGLLAITPSKQRKLIRTAQTFLGKFPDFANDACRFDVAAVRCDRLPNAPSTLPDPLDPVPKSIQTSPDSPQIWHGHRLALQHYLPNAFDLSA